jgi:MYXO-CTERM domain-containing protein
LDANNNVVTAPVTWSATTASGAITQGGVFTAGTMSGNYPAAVTGTVNGISGSASVTISAGALAQITVTPSVATTQAGGTVGFTASGRDGNGNTVAITPTWSVVAGGGTISPTGVFSAGTTTGTFANTVRAESNGVTAFATVTVSAGPLARLELTPSSVTLDPGYMQQFSAMGQDAFGNAVNASITWTSNVNAGSITAGGLFTAGNIPGDFADGVTATSGAITATASVRVGMPIVADAGMDAGMDAGTEMDAGMDAGMTQPDAGMQDTDAGLTMMPDAGTGNISGNSGCGCTSTDAMAPLLGLIALALRRRRSR